MHDDIEDLYRRLADLGVTPEQAAAGIRAAGRPNGARCIIVGCAYPNGQKCREGDRCQFVNRCVVAP